MAYHLPAHLHRNRHGALYFRHVIPQDIPNLVGQREIYRSLKTTSVRENKKASQTLTIALGVIFTSYAGFSTDTSTPVAGQN